MIVDADTLLGVLTLLSAYIATYYLGRAHQRVKDLSQFYHVYFAHATLYVRCRVCQQDVLDDGHDAECVFGKLTSDKIQPRPYVWGE
jgi:hypothetical protein